MPTLSVEQVSPGVYQWRCNDCQKPIDITDTNFLRYVLQTGDVPYCFDCDNVHLGHHPKLFWNYWEYDWIISDGKRPRILTAFQFNAESGMLERSVTGCSLTFDPLEIGYILAELGAKRHNPACPVLHISTPVRENEE